MNFMSHIIAHCITGISELDKMSGIQLQYMFIRLVCTPNSEQNTRFMCHLNVITEHIGDFVGFSKIGKPVYTSAVFRQKPYIQISRIKCILGYSVIRKRVLWS